MYGSGRFVGVVVAAAVVMAVPPAATAAEAPALSLLDCLAAAMRNDPALRAAAAGRAVAEADVRIAGGWPNPEIEADSSAGTPRPAVVARQSLPFFERRGAVAVARGEMKEGELDVEELARQVRHDVRVHFYEVLHSERAVALARAALDEQRRIEEMTRTRFEAEDVAELEVKSAALGALRAEAELAALEGELGIARARLASEIGFRSGAELTLAGELEALPSPPALDVALRTLTDGLPGRQLTQRRATESARLALARALAAPSITIGIGRDFGADGGPDTLYNLTIGVPVFSHGSAERARAHAALDRLDLERAAVVSSVEIAVAAAGARLEAARRQVALYAESVLPIAVSTREAYREAYREGAVGLIELLQVERDAREAEIGQAQALLDAHVAHADLEQAAGMELLP